MSKKLRTLRRAGLPLLVACLSGANFSSHAATLMDDLYGYWPFEEGTGTALNDFSNNHAGGILRQNNGAAPVGLGPGGSMWVNDPVRGTVLGFTGNDPDGYAFLGAEVIPATDLTDGFTWSFWAKSDQASNNDIILGNRYGTDNQEITPVRQWVKFTNAQFEWRPSDVAGNLDYANVDVQSTWMHHMVVRNGDSMVYYRDGVPAVTRTGLTVTLDSPLPLFVGGQGRENWRGYVDDVMLFRRALSPDEVELLYQLSAGGSLSGLLTPGPAQIATTLPGADSTGAAFDTTIDVTIVEGSTTVNDSTVQFTVNGQVVPHTIGERTQLSPEVSMVVITAAAPQFPNLYPAGSTVNAMIRFDDTAGTSKELTWSFGIQDYVTVPPTWAVSDVDTTKPGFLVRTHILDNRRHVFGDRGTRIPPAEKQLAGRVGPNVANPEPFTENGYFVEDQYINYNQSSIGRGDAVSSEGMFGANEIVVKPENAIPGMEGATIDPAGENAFAAIPASDHTAVEILAYLDLPAGVVTLGVNSDDGFRLTLSPIGAPTDKFGVLISEFDAGRGSSATQGTEARIVVEQAGKYAFRLMWFEGQGGSNAEWYSLNSEGNPILINDPDEPTAIKAYTSRTGPVPVHVSTLEPFPFGSTLAFAFPDHSIFLEITHGTTALDPNSIVLKVNGQVTTPTTATSNGKTTIELAPPGGLWPPGNLGVELSYSQPATTHSWTVPMIPYVTLEECLRTAPGTGSDPGMNWFTHYWQANTGTRANTVTAAEDQLANQPNAAELSGAVDGYFQIANVNFRDELGDGVQGMIGETRLPPRDDFEDIVPGLPATAPSDPNNLVGVALTYIEFPAPGLYYMGVNRDDGFRLTVATTEGGRDLINGPNIQEIGVYNGGGGTDANNVQMNGFMAIYVPQAGVWPFRLLWWEGNSGGSVEWFQTNEQLPIGLVNGLNPDTLRAFRSRTALPPALDSVTCSPAPSPSIVVSRTATGITLTYEGVLQEASEITGTFTDVQGASSPWPVQTSESMKFYRTRGAGN